MWLDLSWDLRRDFFGIQNNLKIINIKIKMLHWLRSIKKIFMSQRFGYLHKPSSGVIKIQSEDAW